MPKIERKCNWCKDKFMARQADVNRGWAKFCSKSCKAKKQTARYGYKFDFKADRREREYNEIMSECEAGWDGHKGTF